MRVEEVKLEARRGANKDHLDPNFGRTNTKQSVSSWYGGQLCWLRPVIPSFTTTLITPMLSGWRHQDDGATEQRSDHIQILDHRRSVEAFWYVFNVFCVFLLRISVNLGLSELIWAYLGLVGLTWDFIFPWKKVSVGPPGSRDKRGCRLIRCAILCYSQTGAHHGNFLKNHVSDS